MKNSSKALHVLLAFAITAVVGCQFDPYADWFVKKNVAEDRLVGHYRVTNETIQHFATTKVPGVPDGRLTIAREAQIDLEKNHKISVAHVPIDWAGRECIMEGHGIWSVGKHQDFTAVSVKLILTKPSSPVCPKGEFGFDLELFDDSMLHAHSNTKYPLLHLTIGDPDMGDAVQFEKD
jgi:hypothetical protein